MRALYRARQLLSSLRPRIDAKLRAEADGLLREPERVLFETMTLRDQQHCLEVYGRLRERGHDEPGLLAAALLHDVGKGPVALWHRVAYVVLEAAAPKLLDRLAKLGAGAGWREALYRCRHHASLGAEQAHRAGASEQVVALIRADAPASEDASVVALRAADDAA
ncbi:MAG: HD domain-containing protein [Chloroflexi bacterium]|nr:HD domain-containing protein [Chloroflexota bacterium]